MGDEVVRPEEDGEEHEWCFEDFCAGGREVEDLDQEQLADGAKGEAC